MSEDSPMSAASSAAPSTAGFSSQRGGRIEMGAGSDMWIICEMNTSLYGTRVKRSQSLLP